MDWLRQGVAFYSYEGWTEKGYMQALWGNMDLRGAGEVEERYSSWRGREEAVEQLENVERRKTWFSSPQR